MAYANSERVKTRSRKTATPIDISVTLVRERLTRSSGVTSSALGKSDTGDRSKMELGKAHKEVRTRTRPKRKRIDSAQESEEEEGENEEDEGTKTKVSFHLIVFIVWLSIKELDEVHLIELFSKTCASFGNRTPSNQNICVSVRLCSNSFSDPTQSNNRKDQIFQQSLSFT